jgi:hypothetical protein
MTPTVSRQLARRIERAENFAARTQPAPKQETTVNEPKKQRPQLGQRVRITGIVEKSSAYTGREFGTIVRTVWNHRSHEATGVYIGYRTVYEGEVFRISEDEGNGFIPQNHLEVWLIVTDARRNTIRCLPEQVIVESDVTP